MCGITGIFSAKADYASPALVETMNDAIFRRGPDEGGSFTATNIALAMRRLSIIGVHNGKQPIFNESKDVVTVFNGEIYNHKELRAQLEQQGHTFYTDCDTEVIVHLYEEYGTDFPNYLDGMFAIALWDTKTKKLYLVRDRFGIKPLFIKETEDSLLFGSEIKTILAAQPEGYDLDLQAVDEYLTYTYIPAPKTIYKQIRKVEAGFIHEYSLNDDKLVFSKSSYYELLDNTRTKEQSQQAVESLIKQSVKSHMESDVPVGSFLSGGVDSSLISTLAQQHVEQKLETFTVSFSGNNHIDDELPYAQEVIRQQGMNENSITVKPDLEQIIDDVIYAFDEPFADDSVVPSFYVYELAAKKVKTTLSGLGGDELFGGYNRYKGILLAQKLRHFPKPLSKLVLKLLTLVPEPKDGGEKIDHLKRFFKGLLHPLDKTYFSYLSSIEESEKKQLYTSKLFNAINLQETEQVTTKRFQAAAHLGALNASLYTDIKTYLPDDILALSDRLSMWHSLEVRVPFIQHTLMESALALPESEKIAQGTTKKILKEIAKSHVPASIISHKKQGFEAPMAGWIKSDLLAFYQAKLSESKLNKHGLFRAKDVKKLLDDHVTGANKNNKVLFSLLVFQQWYDNNAFRIKV